MFLSLKSLSKTLRNTALIASVSFGVSCFSAGAADATTLDQAIKLSLEHNPRIGIVARNREAVLEELRQVRGLYLPTVDLNAGVDLENTSTPAIRATGDDNEDLTATDATLTVSQRLFDGYERANRVERQKARIESAANRVYENSEVLALDVIGSFLDVIRQRELLALSRENVAFHVQTLEGLVQRLQGGIGNRADVTQTQSRLALARSTFVQTNQDLADAEAQYTRLVGQFPGDLTLPASPVNALPRSMEELVRLATVDNPTVKITQADVKVANADVEISESEFYPQVNLEASSSYDNDDDGTTSYTYRNTVGLRMNWNLFNGGTDRATRQELLYREEQSKSERFDTILEAQEEARISWYSYVASQQRLQEFSSSVIFATETRDAYEQQFQVGQRTLLDLLDAENEVFTSRGQLITADINQMRSAFRMLAVAGRLLKTMNIQAAEQSSTEAETFSESMSRVGRSR